MTWLYMVISISMHMIDQSSAHDQLQLAGLKVYILLLAMGSYHKRADPDRTAVIPEVHTQSYMHCDDDNDDEVAIRRYSRHGGRQLCINVRELASAYSQSRVLSEVTYSTRTALDIYGVLRPCSTYQAYLQLIINSSRSEYGVESQSYSSFELELVQSRQLRYSYQRIMIMRGAGACSATFCILACKNRNSYLGIYISPFNYKISAESMIIILDFGFRVQVFQLELINPCLLCIGYR